MHILSDGLSVVAEITIRAAGPGPVSPPIHLVSISILNAWLAGLQIGEAICNA